MLQRSTIAAALALAVLASPASARDSVSRDCLTGETRAALAAAEAHFGVTFAIVSTCRPGAVIAGSGDPSWHRYGRAVDLLVPRGMSKAAVVGWFYAHVRGVVMTYRNMGHVHFDTGTYHKLVRGADFACRANDSSLLIAFVDTAPRQAQAVVKRLVSVLRNTMLQGGRRRPVAPDIALTAWRSADTAASLLARITPSMVAAE